MNYDVLVLGNTREGLQQAMASAESGDHVAIVCSPDSSDSLDSMRLAAKNLSEKGHPTMYAFRTEVYRLQHAQRLVDEAELDLVGVQLIQGRPKFVSADSVEIVNGRQSKVISANRIVLACGTKSLCPNSLRIDDRFVLTTESLLEMPEIPRSAIVIGAGKIGSAVTIILATLGVEVITVDQQASLFPVSDLLDFALDAVELKMAFRLGDEAVGTELRPDLEVAVRLSNGRELVADAAFVCVGREGNTAELNLDVANVGLDERGRIWCDAEGRTWNPGIYALGDVVGFPRRTNVAKIDAMHKPAGPFKRAQTRRRSTSNH